MLGFIGDDGAGAWGNDHEALKRAVVEQFVLFFGPEAAHPQQVIVQDWNDELWSRGGPVHLLGPGSLTQDREAICAPVGRLHWAGTETASFWPATWTARSVGRRAAAEVLAALSTVL